mmetsp:Transcript_36348/g.93710  ORF Transcript_36348/g.93710 Transcript_36348/m.93710 type:complete len:271 (-) Transcript_36348:54-866(-)
MGRRVGSAPRPRASGLAQFVGLAVASELVTQCWWQPLGETAEAAEVTGRVRPRIERSHVGVAPAWSLPTSRRPPQLSFGLGTPPRTPCCDRTQVVCRARGGQDSKGPIENVVGGIKRFFGLEKKDEKPKPPAPISPFEEFSKTLPLPLKFVGALLRPLASLVGGLLKDSQSDIQAVLDQAQSALRRSGRCGPNPQVGPILGQSYASMNINGQKSAQVQLQFQVQGDKIYSASCSAVIQDNGVELRDLQVDGSGVDISGASSVGGVIDVER